ncbi:MAG TPA: hypothetical protein VFF08_08685 [Trueperaceae bacterium]|nr:hypothetical protein [Trueperaceae bacterium]
MSRNQLVGAALLVVGLMAFAPERFTGPALLWGLALAFYAAYRRRRRGTWALVAFGVLASVAATATVDSLFPRWDEGVVFVLGMTATFTAIYLLPRERGGARWALWPALAWAFITLLVNDPWGGLARWVAPLVMIGAGVVFLGWTKGGR